MTLDGQVYSQANPTCEDARTSLLTCLGQLEQEGQLEPFERWAAEADHNNIHNWLFAIGNDTLQLMEREAGVDRWLDRATPALKTFMAKRLEDIAASNATVLVANPYKWAENPLLHVRKLAQEQGISKPTDAEKEQVQRWVEAGYKNPVAHYDFARLRTGLTQAAIMAHQLKELTAQRRLLGWIEKAPVEVLERAVLVPDATGHTLVSLLLKELVNLSSPSNDRTARREKDRARPIGQVVVDALKSMTQRLGPETMGRALERDGNLVGMVAGFVRADYSSSTVVNRTQDRLVGDMVELMQVLEALGVATGPTAVLASFQRTPEEREHQGNLGSPQHLRAFLEPLSPQTDWGPLIAPLVQRQLEASLGDAPQNRPPAFLMARKRPRHGAVLHAGPATWGRGVQLLVKAPVPPRRPHVLVGQGPVLAFLVQVGLETGPNFPSAGQHAFGGQDGRLFGPVQRLEQRGDKERLVDLDQLGVPPEGTAPCTFGRGQTARSLPTTAPNSGRNFRSTPHRAEGSRGRLCGD